MRSYKVTLWLIILNLAIPAQAADTTGAFLKIGVGARPIGMGNAFTAVADDINALAWNPAGLAKLNKRELGVMHAELFADTYYDFLGYAHPTRLGTLGMGINYLSQAEIEGRGLNREISGKFAAYDLAVTLSYAKPISIGDLGVNLKLLKSRIGDVSATGWAVDVGGIYKTWIPGLNAGLAVQNLGPGFKFLDEGSRLPLIFASGLGYQTSIGMILALDVKHRPYDSNTLVSFGTEYPALSAVTLRAGYLAALAGNETGTVHGGQSQDLRGLATGLGFKISNCRLDYAFSLAGELGSVHRFSLGAKF